MTATVVLSISAGMLALLYWSAARLYDPSNYEGDVERPGGFPVPDLDTAPADDTTTTSRIPSNQDLEYTERDLDAN